jgi:hypothetical protein
LLTLLVGLRTAAFLLLAFAPGAWVAFGLPLDGMKFRIRLLTAMMLSPLIVCGEFYAIRLTGVPFEVTAVLLAILNLPAGYLIWKRRVKMSVVDRRGFLVAAAVIAVPLVCMISLLVHPEVRIFGAHSWIHADAVYMFARGDLVLEDPTLAGMIMPYPVWSPLAFDAVHGYLVSSPPMVCYVWSNLLWLIGACGFAAAIVKEMGGGCLAELSSGILLLLGANPLGHILMQVAPAGDGLWGDARYTPWVQKFLLFGPMALALGMLMAMIYLLIRSGPRTMGLMAVVCLLLSGIGLLYPLLFPAACAIVGVKALAPLLEKRRTALAWIGILLIAAVATYAEVRFLTAGRHAATGPVLLSTIRRAAGKTGASLIGTCVFLAGTAFTVRDSWRMRRTATVVLLGGALASYVLYIAFHVLYYENEYKFIFSAVACLMVFPALAVDRIWQKWTRPAAIAALTGTALLVLGAYGDWVYRYWPAPWVGHTHASYERSPMVDATGFRLQMDPREKWSGACNAVLRMTPANSILLVDDSSLYFPLLTERSLYVSPANKIYPGINLNADDLDADVRGYGREIIEARRSTLAGVFSAGDASRREQAIHEVLSLRRPVAIIAESRHRELLDWLQNSKTARRLFTGNGLSVWLFELRIIE